MQPPSVDQCTELIYALMVHNKTPLYGPWQGWRMAGRELVSPDGTRFTTERLRGMAWQQDASNRLNATRARKAQAKAGLPGSMVKVLIIPLADWQAQHFGRSAG